MENTFIVRYRRALRELQEAFTLQYALIDESDALRTLAYQQEQASEKAILKNRKSGRGFLISRLTECVEEEHNAWAVTQHLKRQIKEMEAGGYDSVVDNEQNHALYGVIGDAISVLLDVLGNQFPKKLTAMNIATYRGVIPMPELILRFGPVPLQRIVRQRLKAAANNPAPATTEPPQPGRPAFETPAAAVAAYPWAEIEALALQIELRKDGRFTPAGNRIAAAVAGLIDALLDNNIISDTVTRPIHYANFSEHYGQPIGADRVKPTRTHWHQKARKELGLPDLKPPKLRA